VSYLAWTAGGVVMPDSGESPVGGRHWLGPYGLYAGCSGLGRRWIGPSGSAQTERIGFLFFSNLVLMQKQFQNIYKLFKGTKNTPKIIKIPGKFPELDWGTNNPNKVFGAQEKDFRAF
jgi:hypothetical protein